MILFRNLKSSLIPLLRYTIYALFVCCGISSCKKFVQISPPGTEVTGVTVYSNNTSAAAAMTGVYSNLIMNPGLPSGNISLSILEGMAADELTNYSTGQQYVQFYTNGLNSANSDPGWWMQIYQEIHTANAILEGLASSTGVTPALKNQLIGEAEFIRAFLHFYATNLYGDVPLVTTTNYLANNSIKRTPQAQVYEQIISDLKSAQSLLTDNFLDPYGNVTQDRVRPNKDAATALLARVYLYTSKWDSAEAEATSIINNTTNYNLDSLNNVFLANSTETIWQLQSITPGYNTWDAPYLVLTSPPGTGMVACALSSYLLNTFEAGDERLKSWVGAFTSDSINYYYFPFKYKNWIFNPSQSPTEYTTVFRLAEQYLIRAEARAEQGNIQGSQSDLNVIRTRAGLPNTTASDQQSLLSAILHERQVELFAEWGHRWFDLIRTKNIGTVMSNPGNICQAKGGSWNQDWTLMPIPESEIQINLNLTQNPGY